MALVSEVIIAGGSVREVFAVSLFVDAVVAAKVVVMVFVVVDCGASV